MLAVPDDYIECIYDNIADPILHPISTRLQRVLSHAERAATESTSLYRHGSALFSGNRILSIGHNTAKRPVGWTQYFRVLYFSRHAEIACMHGLLDTQIKGKDLLVCRLGASGNLLLSKPCEKCLQVMEIKGVRRCYYTISSDAIGIRTFRSL
jgi:hypothetical protein